MSLSNYNLELLNDVLIEDLFPDEKIIGIELFEIEEDLSAVVEYTVDTDNTLSSGGYVSSCREINLHELVHKCKRWAYKLGYRFTIEEDKVKIAIKKDLTYYLTTITNINQGDNFIPFDPYIEIKACQWIYDQMPSKGK